MMNVKLFPELARVYDKVANFDHFEFNEEFEILRDTLVKGELPYRESIEELKAYLSVRFHAAKVKFECCTPTTTEKEVYERRIRKMARLGTAYYSLRALLKNSGKDLLKALDYLFWYNKPHRRRVT